MKPEGTAWPIWNKNAHRKDRAMETLEKLDYEYFQWERLKTVCVGQFTFDGFKNSYLDLSLISRFLYDYAQVCFFVDDAINELLCLPCEILLDGICGMPTRVKVFSPYINGYTRILDVRAGDDFYVCFDSSTRISSKFFFIPWITEISELSLTMRVNAFGLRAPIVTLSDLTERLSMENIMQKYFDGQRIIELKDNKAKLADGSDKDPDLSKRIKTLDLSPQYYLDKLQAQRRAIWNELLETLGFKVNTAPYKKERAITGEVEGNAEETAAFYTVRKKPRLDAVKWLREHGFKNAVLIEETKVENILKESGEDNGSLVKVHNNIS